MPANRRKPDLHQTARQSRDRQGALADSVAGVCSLTVAARIWGFMPSTFMSRSPTPTRGTVTTVVFEVYWEMPGTLA
jgi:hypothetical protein